MGWREHTVVVKITGWPVGGGTMPGMGAVKWTCFVENMGEGQEGLEKRLAGLWGWRGRGRGVTRRVQGDCGQWSAQLGALVRLVSG